MKAADSNSILVVVVILSALLLHGLFVSHHIRKLTLVTLEHTTSPAVIPSVVVPQTNVSRPVHVEVPDHISSRPEYPDVFIYRRTKKTGSSSMLEALLSQLKPLGYVGLYSTNDRMAMQVRFEYSGHSPRRLLVAEHNRITKSIHPQRSAIIADTIRDGYNQMTSYCRFVMKVKSCKGDEMLQCLNSREALRQNEYRWADRASEDEDTYIDMPLSTEHPALSTTIFRKVFPNATLDVKKFNVKGSTCEEDKEIRDLYMKKYGKLEQQILRLRQRMLILAGYPEKGDESNGKISIEDMLDEADKREQKKYDIGSGNVDAEGKYSMDHRELINTIYKWNRGEDGTLKLEQSRPQKMN